MINPQDVYLISIQLKSNEMFTLQRDIRKPKRRPWHFKNNFWFHWLSKTFQEFVSYIRFAKNKVPILVCSFGSPILTLWGDVVYGWSLEQTNALLNNLFSPQLKTSFERLNGLKSKHHIHSSHIFQHTDIIHRENSRYYLKVYQSNTPTI